MGQGASCEALYGETTLCEVYGQNKSVYEGSKAVFEAHPFTEGKRRLIHKGKFVNGDFDGRRCIVRSLKPDFRGQAYYYAAQESVVEVYEQARDLADSFCKEIWATDRCDKQVLYHRPLFAIVDKIERLASAKKEPISLNMENQNEVHSILATGTSVTIEDWLYGDFIDFMHNDGKKELCHIPQAFAHYTWHKSDGKILVSNPKGVCLDSCFHLTNPTIHSADTGQFGCLDKGKFGMIPFFDTHECNEICKDFDMPDPTYFGWSERADTILETYRKRLLNGL